MKYFDELIESKIVKINASNETKKIEIEITKNNGKLRYLISATGVYDVLIEGFRLNNIIEILLDHSKMDNANALSKLQLMMVGEENYVKGRFPHVDEKSKEIQNGVLQFWEIQPIYGASVLIASKQISLHLIDG
ncbi:hypothetical protein [Xanthomonas sp. SHU 199]|uniref:hypothetical protein n=1 Tax=Xanthomonas sp. SHU 199 TaxID=1591174 RepID=UPI0012FE8B25|nr:hypothetical protein [Xanthomonas sp. SHU 199]